MRRLSDKSYGRSGTVLSLAWTVVLTAILFLAPDAMADSERIDQVKAAFVLNIARFVSWPEESLDSENERLLLCVYRSDSFDEAFETIKGKMVSGRSIEIALIPTLLESGPCHILFIADSELAAYTNDADADQESTKPLLTIADLTDRDPTTSVRPDVLISLVRNGSRIGFEINLAKSRRAGLRMSSRLLKLARIVGEGTCFHENSC